MNIFDFHRQKNYTGSIEPHIWLNLPYLGTTWELEDFGVDADPDFYPEGLCINARGILKKKKIDLLKYDDKLSMYINGKIYFDFKSMSIAREKIVSWFLND